jgi:hypothetical protein
MDEAAYQNWRKELDQWLAQREAQPIACQSTDAAARPVLKVMAQARQTVAGINATAPGVKILDLNKYENLAAIMDDILAMESFSLAEYTYDLPGGKHPGVRLWYDAPGGAPQITVLLFEDVHLWRVDASGEKISWQTLHLDLGGKEPAPALPEGAGRFFTPGQGWRGALIDALCLPVRLFHLAQ